jgi:hypothetical protein
MFSHSLTQRARWTVLAVSLGCLLLHPAGALGVSGSAVGVAWDQSSDTTVVGYNVYYGPASRTYTNVIDAGGLTNTVVSNLVSGVTYYFAATTYTAAGLESYYSTEASYTVPVLNVPPTLSPIPDVTMAQDSGQQTVQLAGITSGSSNEVQTLSVSAFSSNPALIANPVVTYSSPDTTGTLAFSSAQGSFGSTIITVLVDDGGVLSNTVIRTFVVNVIPIENPPTIDPIQDLFLNENAGAQTVSLTGITAGWTNSTQAMMVTAVSSDPSIIPNLSVNYSTPATTGSLKFAPVTNSYGAARITVTVSDAQPTNNTTSISFLVTVNQTVVQGSTTNFTVIPNNTLRVYIPTPATNGDKFDISMASGAPKGATVTTRRGLSWLVWTPTAAQASSTNTIGININDLTTPALSTHETIIVTVLDYVSLLVGSASIQAGQNGSVPLALASSEAVTNLSFTLAWPANALPAPTLSTSMSAIGSSSIKLQGTNLLVKVQTSSGHALTGSNIIGSISFQSSATQASGYLNLPVSSIVAYKPGGIQYANSLLTPGQVAVVNSLAMLQASTTGTAGRTLTILGKTGVNYQVQYCTNVAGRGGWYPLTSYMQTNIVQVISVDPSLFHAYYRVQQQ